MTIMIAASALPTGVPVQVLTFDISDTVGNPDPAGALISFRTNGEAWEELTAGSDSKLFDWLLAGSPGDYELRCTVNSGSLDSFVSDSVNTWLALSSEREFGVVQEDPGTASANITIEIRNASTSTVLDSGSGDLEAEQF